MDRAFKTESTDGDQCGDLSANASTILPINQIVCGHAAEVMATWPSRSIDLIITSPPYWNAVIYDGVMPPWPSYQDYLDDLQTVWAECARVLRPNGKLCINAMAMPTVPQRLMRQETRVLKHIPGDIYHGIVTGTDLRFYEEFVWQKQTSKLMMLGAGRRPRPGNSIACNSTERITIYVKPGKPRKFPASVIAANEMPQAIKRDLAQQVWCMIPARNKHQTKVPETQEIYHVR
jgi:hypothetical protein